ncbi:ATP-binding cassette domain-containing protein [Massilia dura]|uniref:ATP-binding cassette domain-containing protein n=1 Tax=Pseudoduganella dura TaxID=321982 RepID=A0A6I3XJ88_9BURK|nr:ABC transporter ATP-binding protein [Pseudoduganella dura]MUI16519.1 ATP-binding cassette domain-containing protein [Pseudoduganella dura]
MPEPALRLSHVVRRHSGRTVLDGVDLALAPGEILGIAGVNGAGKTTLLRCLLDFCAIDSGAIAIFGLASTLPAARRQLAYLPERFSPPAHLTGGEFLAHVAALHGRRPDGAATTAMLQALELDAGALRRTARHYSKGMTQKLGLAATLLLDKRLYVLDEPASGLDPKARALFKRAASAQRAGGAAILLTSHALADIGELCDRIAILDGGRIRFAGTPDECLRHYGAASLEQAFLDAVG